MSESSIALTVGHRDYKKTQYVNDSPTDLNFGDSDECQSTVNRTPGDQAAITEQLCLHYIFGHIGHEHIISKPHPRVPLAYPNFKLRAQELMKSQWAEISLVVFTETVH